MSANIKASTDGTQAIIGVGGVDQMTVSNSGVVTANSFVGSINNSSVTATGSTTARTLANRFADVVNVKDFGAIGDGVTDDTDAIQAAINKTTEVFFPSGTYIVSRLLIPSNTTLSGEAGPSSIIKRKDNTSNGYFIKSDTSQNIGFNNLTIDGNKSNQTVGYHNILFNECQEICIRQCKLINAKTYAGIAIQGGTNEENSSRSIIEDNFFENNDNSGIYVNKESYISIETNHFKDNGSDGVTVINYVFPPVATVENYFILNGNRCINNSGCGIRFVGFYEGGTPNAPIYGPLVPPQKCVIISNNICKLNKKYGIAFAGIGGNIFGNYCEKNGDSAFNGGIVATSWNTSITNNIIYDNYYYGIDIGGSKGVILNNNIISYQGITSNSKATGLNIGGAVESQVCHNLLENNGATGSTGGGSTSINLSGYESTGGGSYFDQVGAKMQIIGNTIRLSSSNHNGIRFFNGGNDVILTGNQVFGAAAEKAFILSGGTEVFNIIEKNNVDWSNGGIYTTIPSASNLIIPDTGEDFYISGTTSINNIFTKSDNDFNGKVRFVSITNGGSGYDPASPPLVSFSGGGGSGAAGTALVSNSGKVIGVEITNNGSGYTSAPTVSFSSGSAVGSAKIGCNNFFGRIIRLQFLGTLTVINGGNLSLNGNYSSGTNSDILVLKGAFNRWYEVSRI